MNVAPPIVTRQTIADGLRAVGLEPGDGVYVHSSLSSFGRVEGGPDAVVDAILDLLGDDGTVVFPTFTGDAVIAAVLGLSGHSGAVILPDGADVDLDDLATVKEQHIFTGAIPKAARRRDDFIGSNHPLYSICARGPLAEEIVASNEKYIFFSHEDKDIYLLGQHGGKTLLLGTKHVANSSIHLVSEFAGLEYKMQDRPYWKLTVADFLAMPREKQAELLRLHCGMTLPYDITKQYDRIEGPLKEAGAINIGRIGNAEVRLMKILEFLRVGLEAVKKDPWLLADKVPKEE